MSGYLQPGATQAQADRWLDGEEPPEDVRDLAAWERDEEIEREADWWDSLEELDVIAATEEQTARVGSLY